MTSAYRLAEGVNLHVKNRISAEDAARQERTAREILIRLHDQPGVVLADEVGMGKTFVALAVAASVTLHDAEHRPVVVMVPPSLKEKWPSDFGVFRDKCLAPEMAAQMRCGSAERAVEFLKLLDDPPHRRKSVIFVTHGAMSRGLDSWVKLALIREALERHGNPDGLKEALARFAGTLLWLEWAQRRDEDIWSKLLKSAPSEWMYILRAAGINPDGEGPISDDPVPLTVLESLQSIDLEPLHTLLNERLPRRATKHFDEYMQNSRRGLSGLTQDLWKECLKRIKLHLPLLILDEAHHLKNSQTRLASLFQMEESREDAEQVSKGALSGVFERMVFLTATPFQLGHHELCNVLDRFRGIRWEGAAAPVMGLPGYDEKLKSLRLSLDAAQEAAVLLDGAWGRLKKDDVVISGQAPQTDEQWTRVLNSDGPTPALKEAMASLDRTRRAMKEAESALRPWVLRHLKSRHLPDPHAGKPRRRRLTGNITNPESLEAGISVSGKSLLPFLLAARATACTPESRPVFAEGLASSYEAFLQTRAMAAQEKNEPTNALTDLDEDAQERVTPDSEGRWYLDQLAKFIPLNDPDVSASHPKIAATVQCVREYWRRCEKVVVFCHYIETGRVLRNRISEAIDLEIQNMAVEKLKCLPGEVAKELERLGDRFFDPESPLRQECDSQIKNILAGYPDLKTDSGDLIDVVRRSLRTPSFLVRYFPIGGDMKTEAMAEALSAEDMSGQSLRQLLQDFFRFLSVRCGEQERRRYIQAMQKTQAGSYYGAEALAGFSEDEKTTFRGEKLVPNVRLVNGATEPETRQRLMLTFNTPFYPDVLIASSVMAEGVDLHLNCRHMIHHDLCWNPSTLEQRTGRIDRIGSKVERCGLPIQVGIPYIAETQDEKMYRVVMDRERWFNVVMGEDYKVDARTVDRLADRVPLPLLVAEQLKFQLGCQGLKLSVPVSTLAT